MKKEQLGGRVFVFGNVPTCVLIFFPFLFRGAPGGNGEDSGQKRVADSLNHWLLPEVLVNCALGQQYYESENDKGKWNEEDIRVTEEADDANVHGEREEEGESEGDTSS